MMVAAYSFWAAVAALGIAVLLAGSKMPFTRPGRITPHHPRGAARILVLGLSVAFLIALVPNLWSLSSDVAGGLYSDEGGGHQPGVVEYVGTLSTGGLWTAGAIVAVWVVAYVATLAMGFMRHGPK